MRISVLVEGSPLAVLAHAMRTLDANVKREIGTRTKAPAATMWREEMAGKAEDRRQFALANSGAVGVTQSNVTLRAGAGKLSSGTPISDITTATEFGMSATAKITTRSRKGKSYQRRVGPTFGPRRRSGKVAYPAAREVIARIASLWVQTAHRTIHETIERL